MTSLAVAGIQWGRRRIASAKVSIPATSQYGGQTHIKGCVNDGEVKREQKHDGFLEQEDPWASQCRFKQLSELDLLVLFKLASILVTHGH